MKLKGKVYSTRGVREDNQDSANCWVNNHGYPIFVVADGMGGHFGGQIASKLVVEGIYEYFNDFSFESMDEDTINRELQNSLYPIFSKMKKISKEKPELSNMGTTVILGVQVGDYLHTLNIGDSRATIITITNVISVTNDQNLASLAKRDERYSEYSNSYNLLISSFGPNMESTIDFFKTKIFDGVKLMFTTDGVHNSISEQEILSIANSEYATFEKAKKIVEVAFNNGSTDNLTCIFMEAE